jgi:hypothetical protein
LQSLYIFFYCFCLNSFNFLLRFISWRSYPPEFEVVACEATLFFNKAAALVSKGFNFKINQRKANPQVP